jgi:hypothetical protein
VPYGTPTETSVHANCPCRAAQSVQKLEPLEPITLDQLKDRMAASILSNPDDWRDDEAIAGEDGPPQDEQELLDARIAGVRAADSVEGIWEFLYCR